MELTTMQKNELDELAKRAFTELESYRLACKRLFPEEDSLRTIHCSAESGETFVYTKGKNKSEVLRFGRNLFSRNKETKRTKQITK